MRVPPDLPVRLPPRTEATVPLSEAIGAEPLDWESTSEALDAAAASAADEIDNAHDHEHEESSGRRGPDWPELEVEEDTPPGELDASRRPDLANGFWVLPDQRPYLPRVAPPGRARLVADVSPALSTDLAGRRQTRREQDARDDDDHVPPQRGHRDGNAPD